MQRNDIFNEANIETVNAVLKASENNINNSCIEGVFAHLPCAELNELSVDVSGILVFDPEPLEKYKIDLSRFDAISKNFKKQENSEAPILNDDALSQLKAQITKAQEEMTGYLILRLYQFVLNDQERLAIVLQLLYRSTKITLNETQILTVYTCLIGGQRQIGQVDTGEGKSRILMVLAACKVLEGKTVDFITANMSLARRDLQEYMPFFQCLYQQLTLLIRTSLIYSDSPASEYRMGGINFSDLGQMSLFRNRLVTQGNLDKGLNPDPASRCVLGDEFDMLFMDSLKRMNHSESVSTDADTQKDTWIYSLIVRYMLEKRFANLLIKIDEKTMELRDFNACYADFLNWVLVDSVACEYKDDIKRFDKDQIRAMFSASAVAYSLKEGQHYVCEYDQTVLTREGVQIASRAVARIESRLSRDSHYSFGVHQFIHAWMNVRRDNQLKKGSSIDYLPYAIEPERDIIYSTDAHTFFEQYDDGELIGLSGTLGNEAERRETTSLLNCTWFEAPRDKPLVRDEEPIQLVEETVDKFQAVLDMINDKPSDQPLLLICHDDTEAQLLSQYLIRARVNKNVLQTVDSACTAEAEVMAVKKAGLNGMLTVTTSMFGRGTDIKVECREGLKTVMLHVPSTRDMGQGFGRSARNGERGAAQLILAKNEIKKQFGIESLKISENNPVNFYANPDKFIAYHQLKMSQQHSMKRLVSELELSYRKRLEDHFFSQSHYGMMSHWVKFLRGMDQLWVGKQGVIMKDIGAHKNDVSSFLKGHFTEYDLSVKTLWATLFPCVLFPEPTTCFDEKRKVHISAAHQVANRDIQQMADKKPVVYDAYRKEFGGRMVIYSEIFAETKAFFHSGTHGRRFLDNYWSWYEGRGILFANTRAILNGEREMFANTRAWGRKNGYW